MDDFLPPPTFNDSAFAPIRLSDLASGQCVPHAWLDSYDAAAMAAGTPVLYRAAISATHDFVVVGPGTATAQAA